MGQREDDGIARAGVQLDNFFAQLVFHSEENTREEGALVDVVDDNVLQRCAEAGENVGDEIVGEGAFFFDAVERHLDGIAHGVVHVDDEGLLVVPEEDGATIRGGHETFDNNGNNKGGGHGGRDGNAVG